MWELPFLPKQMEMSEAGEDCTWVCPGDFMASFVSVFYRSDYLRGVFCFGDTKGNVIVFTSENMVNGLFNPRILPRTSKWGSYDAGEGGGNDSALGCSSLSSPLCLRTPGRAGSFRSSGSRVPTCSAQSSLWGDGVTAGDGRVLRRWQSL